MNFKDELKQKLQGTLTQDDGVLVADRFERTISYSYSPTNSDETVLRVNAIADRVTKRCVPSSTRHVSGPGRTAGDGIATVSMREHLCLDESGFDLPVFFVATARTAVPVTLTYQSRTQGESVENDIICEVRSWHVDGTPAGNIAFSWFAEFEAVHIES